MHVSHQVRHGAPAQHELQTVWWQDDRLHLIDQRHLPHQHTIVQCDSVDAAAAAILQMQVRGAPAIGITAAYGMVLATQTLHTNQTAAILATLEAAQSLLNAQRPTAVNLAWATARILARARSIVAISTDTPLAAVQQGVLTEAHAILAEDLAMCHAIGEHGAPLIPERGVVLTHCNAGGLATAGYGTALAPIRTAHAGGRSIHVYVDETRPYLQGARLTTWELQQAGIAQTLIPDSMAGSLMRQGAIDCVLVGADRIAANGDVANKIGTYTLAVLAHLHDVPFYVAAPSSTIDLACADGASIPIEERAASEVTHLRGVALAPAGVAAAHPAFDVTPHTLITAIITEQGVLRAPFVAALKAHVGQQ